MQVDIFASRHARNIGVRVDVQRLINYDRIRGGASPSYTAKC